MPFTRNNIYWQNEAEYNEWVNEQTELIIMNTEEKYLQAMRFKEKNMRISMKALVRETMSEEGFKIKQKNMRHVVRTLFEEA